MSQGKRVTFSLLAGFMGTLLCGGAFVGVNITLYKPIVNLTYPLVGEFSGSLPILIVILCTLPAALIGGIAGGIYAYRKFSSDEEG